MTRIYVPTTGPKDWQALLADPHKHWKRGYSAKTAASCWEASNNRFPPEIARAFTRAEEPSLHSLELLIALPEYQTPLPGGRRASQSDVFALARGSDGVVAIAVEAKVNEDFGPVFDEWFDRPSAGKRARWQFLAGKLDLEGFDPRGVRYQLLHRLASAVIEAERFGARDAVILVHAFGSGKELLDDFRRFVSIWGRDAALGRIITLKDRGDLRLHAGWIPGNRRFLKA